MYSTDKPLTTPETEPTLSWARENLESVRQKHATYEVHKFHLRYKWDVSGCTPSEDSWLKLEVISDQNK